MENVAQYRQAVFMQGQWINGRFEPGYYVSGWHFQVAALATLPADRTRKVLRSVKRGTRLA